MIELADIVAARERVRPYIRRTPLVAVAPAALPELPGADSRRLHLKLESLQVSGSFKARGAVSRVLALSAAERERGLVTASGGNHGLGLAYAAAQVGVPAHIYLPTNASRAKAHRLESYGAHVVWHGEVWDDADLAAREAAASRGWVYVHSFADPEVIAGQGTVGLEVFDDAPETDLAVVAIGGGGLIAGVAIALQELRPGVRVVGVEPVGAPTLHASLRAGRVVALPEITTAANTLAPRTSAQLNFDIIRQRVAEVVLVDDREMLEAARWLWSEIGIAAELSGAAAVAALRCGRVPLDGARTVCAIVCGAGTAALDAG